MTNSEKLHAKSIDLLATARVLYDKAQASAATEKRDVTAEEQAEYRKALDDHEQSRKATADAKRLEDAEAWSGESRGRLAEAGKMDQPTNVQELRELAFRGWCRASGRGVATDEETDAAKKIGFSLGARELEIRLHNDYGRVRTEIRAAAREGREVRALSATLPAAGAYLVPDSAMGPLERAMLSFGGVRNVATVQRTTDGRDIAYPTSNDTGNTGRRIPENTAAAEQDTTFGTVTLHAYEYESKVIRVPNAHFEDSAINTAQLIGEIIGERLGRIMSTDCTTGDGAAKPRGIVTAAAVGKTAASATALVWDEIVELIHSIDPAYRGLGCGFMMNDNTVLKIKLLKDATGRYQWEEAHGVTELPRYSGYPVQIAQEMASVATGTKPILFGLLSKYLIREVNSIRLMRTSELYWASDQTAFNARMRFDGNLIDAGVAPVKCMQMA